VKSSRFTLGKQLRGDMKITDCLHKTGDEDVDDLNAAHLFSVQELADRRRAIGNPIPNDVLKYALIDAFLTEEFVTINARSLRNVFRTRLGKGVLREYQTLAWGMVDCLPGSHAVLFADVIQHVVERDGKESLSEYAQFVLEAWPELLGTSLEEHDQEESH
jgi:thymidylate synthase (FAD)